MGKGLKEMEKGLKAVRKGMKEVERGLKEVGRGEGGGKGADGSGKVVKEVGIGWWIGRFRDVEMVRRPAIRKEEEEEEHQERQISDIPLIGDRLA